MPRSTKKKSAKPVAKAAPQLAQNHPTRMPAPELHTADLKVPEPPPADMQRRSETIIPVEKDKLQDEYLAELAFMEEAITIRIEPSDDDNAPLVVDCWVNGKGAEVLDPLSGRWMELNCLPIGGLIITKRKYVEVLARSRTDRVAGKEVNPRPGPGEDGWKIDRRTVRKTLFSVINDPSPRGAEWLTRLHAER